jgi:predicted enzyme related to lactoylglutathione lyase
MNPVVHFEMPYEDKARAAEFYKNAFGWQAQMLGEDMGSYVVMTTAETDPQTHMVKNPGQINGGMFHRNKPEQSPSIVVAVDDIQVAMKKVAAAGGTVVGGSKGDGQPDEIPGVGLYCSIIDSEGNRISMLQPKRM